jgi:glycosyltransferase involved in cell wall biosynthesis
LDCIKRQGLDRSEYEVIIVNDGSTDNGPELVAEYIKGLSNFRLVNKENGGVSSARNEGLKYANGHYIHFCDADDEIIDNGYSNLLHQCGFDADIIKFSSFTIKSPDTIHNHNNMSDSKILFDGSAHDYVMNYGFNVAIITSLYSNDFLRRNSITFENFALSEDFLFNVRSYTLPDVKVKFTSMIVYGYFVRPNSASRTNSEKQVLRAIDDFSGITTIVNQLKPTYPDFVNRFDERIGSFPAIVFSKITNCENVISGGG